MSWLFCDTAQCYLADGNQSFEPYSMVRQCSLQHSLSDPCASEIRQIIVPKLRKPTAKLGSATAATDEDLNIKYGLFISHNTTSFYSLFIQADNMFRPVFLGHLQVTRSVCLEEVIQVSHKIKYVEL